MQFYRISSAFLLLATSFLLSCDKIHEPYARKTNTSESQGRNILLEEFTGHKCPNCPEASLAAHVLQEENPDLIVISIHTGIFASPNSAGLFTYDFRSDVGDDIGLFFPPPSFPSGMINRLPVDNIQVVNPVKWADAIATFQDDDPIANLIVSNTYDTLTRKVKATVETQFLESYPSALNVTLYITEDSIIKPQYNNNPDIGNTPYIENYAHRHVLRGSFNGTWGSTLTVGAVSYGTDKLSTYTTVLDTAWNDKQCYMVAFISDVVTKEVMQVTEKKIR